MKYWMIAIGGLTLILAALVVAWIRSHRAQRAQAAQLRQENEHLRSENIGLRREIAALEREVEDEQIHSGELDDEIRRLQEEMEQASERVHRAEARRTDAEKEMFATRMRVEQLQQQILQSRTEQKNLENLYQDIISERDQTIAGLQDKLYRRRRKKKNEALDQQITLDDILSGGSE